MAHGHLDRLVSEEFFHGHDVHPTHHQVARKRMPQIMEPALAYPRSLECRFENLSEGVNLLPPSAQEDIRVSPVHSNISEHVCQH